MPGASSKTTARKSSSARRAPSARSSSCRRSCSTKNRDSPYLFGRRARGLLLQLFRHRLGDAVIRITLAESHELLLRLVILAKLAHACDTLEPLLRRFSEIRLRLGRRAAP